MNEIFVKKYWPEDNIMFFLHFRDGAAVRQIEVRAGVRKILSLNNPIDGESMLYDQDLRELDLNQKDFITQEEFETAWEEI